MTEELPIFSRRDLCAICGELYAVTAPEAERVDTCPFCTHPRFVLSGPYKGKTCAWCIVFDPRLMFARWYATPGLSEQFNPHHGDVHRGRIIGPDGRSIPDPDFHMKVTLMYMSW